MSIIKDEINKKINVEYLVFERAYDSDAETIIQTINNYIQDGKIDEVKAFIKCKVDDYKDLCNLFYNNDLERNIAIGFAEDDLEPLLKLLQCAHQAGVDIRDEFRTIVKIEWKLEKDLDAKFKTHPALKPILYSKFLQLNKMLGGVNLDHLLYGLTNDKKSINNTDETDLLHFYAKEIAEANGDKQEIDKVIKKIIKWFDRPISFHADFNNVYKSDNQDELDKFIEAMHAILRAIPKNLVKQKNFIHKILIHKNEIMNRERLQFTKIGIEITDKMKKGNIEKQESIKKEVYNRHMQPVRDYEREYNEFLSSINLSGALDYDQLFKDMDAVEHNFSLAAINAVLEGRR